MIINAKLTVGEIENIKITDLIELRVVDGNNPKNKKAFNIKVLGLVKQDARCNSCNCLLREEGKEFMKKVYCQDCYKRERDRRVMVNSGHKVSPKAFGGHAAQQIYPKRKPKL